MALFRKSSAQLFVYHAYMQIMLGKNVGLYFGNVFVYVYDMK